MVKRKVPAPARGELEEGLSQPSAAAAPDTERTGKEDERRRKPALPAVSCRCRRDLCAAPAATTRTQSSRCRSQTEKEEECKRERNPAPETQVHSHLRYRRHLPACPTIYPPILSPLPFVLPFSPLLPAPSPSQRLTRHAADSGVPSRALPPALPYDDG